MAAGWVDVIRRAIGWLSSLAAGRDIYTVTLHIHQVRQPSLSVNQIATKTMFINQTYDITLER